MKVRNKPFWGILFALIVMLTIIYGGLAYYLSKTSLQPVHTPATPSYSTNQAQAFLADGSLYQKGQIQYHLRCAKCHGHSLEGSLKGPSLNDSTIIVPHDFNTLFHMIHQGNIKKGMPGWGHKLLEEDLIGLTVFIDAEYKKGSLQK